jgi:hypothetical protein
VTRGRKLVLDKKNIKDEKFGGAAMRNRSKMEGNSPMETSRCKIRHLLKGLLQIGGERTREARERAGEKTG